MSIILTQNPEVYNALLARGFKAAQAPSSTTATLFAVHDSSLLTIPEEYRNQCITTNLLCLDIDPQQKGGDYD